MTRHSIWSYMSQIKRLFPSCWMNSHLWSHMMLSVLPRKETVNRNWWHLMPFSEKHAQTKMPKMVNVISLLLWLALKKLVLVKTKTITCTLHFIAPCVKIIQIGKIAVVWSVIGKKTINSSTSPDWSATTTIADTYLWVWSSLTTAAWSIRSVYKDVHSFSTYPTIHDPAWFENLMFNQANEFQTKSQDSDTWANQNTRSTSWCLENVTKLYIQAT